MKVLLNLNSSFPESRSRFPVRLAILPLAKLQTEIQTLNWVVFLYTGNRF